MTNYEAVEQKHTNNIRKMEEDRMDTKEYAGLNEELNMDNTGVHVLKPNWNIFYSTWIELATAIADYDALPTTRGYKSDTLNDTEFKMYYNDLLTYRDEHPDAKATYTEEEHKAVFTTFYKANEAAISTAKEHTKKYQQSKDLDAWTDYCLDSYAKSTKMLLQTLQELEFAKICIKEYTDTLESNKLSVGVNETLVDMKTLTNAQLGKLIRQGVQFNADGFAWIAK